MLNKEQELFSVEEIAKEAGCAYGTIHSRMERIDGLDKIYLKASRGRPILRFDYANAIKIIAYQAKRPAKKTKHVTPISSSRGVDRTGNNREIGLPTRLTAWGKER